MRYPKGHKDATRRRILDIAAARYRAEGTDAVGVQSLMEDAGLTQGGFYNHFASKDDLVRAALVDALHRTRTPLAAVAAEHGLAGLIDGYLSSAHRDDRAEGCPAAALTMDVARGSDALRAAYTSELETTVALIAAHLPRTQRPARRREKALALHALLVGTLALARAVDDATLSEALLAAGRKAARAVAAE